MTNQVIPEAAVEAAAEALRQTNEHDDEWVGEFPTYKDYLRAEATKALEAAAPHMLNQRTQETPMIHNADHEELARIIYELTTENTFFDHAELAAAILAAGYRNPHQVATNEELSNLPEGVVIREQAGAILERHRESGGNFIWLPTGDSDPWEQCIIDLPATIIYRPTP